GAQVERSRAGGTEPDRGEPGWRPRGPRRARRAAGAGARGRGVPGDARGCRADAYQDRYGARADRALEAPASAVGAAPAPTAAPAAAGPELPDRGQRQKWSQKWGTGLSRPSRMGLGHQEKPRGAGPECLPAAF